MTLPRASSPDFGTYFEMVVKTSKTRGEAIRRLGYTSASPVYRLMKRFGIEEPPNWSSSPDVGLFRQQNVPKVVIANLEERPWVASLVQGEGCFFCHYVRISESTTFVIETVNTDPDPIFKLSDLYGLQRPARPKLRFWSKPIWRKDVSGLRAFRVLDEILPFLVGEKRKEAERTLSFFSPDGYHRGCFRAIDVWPSEEFPLRRSVARI